MKNLLIVLVMFGLAFTPVGNPKKWCEGRQLNACKFGPATEDRRYDYHGLGWVRCENGTDGVCWIQPGPPDGEGGGTFTLPPPIHVTLTPDSGS
jgi:hypothetical protein